jgi:hypothetical protein
VRNEIDAWRRRLRGPRIEQPEIARAGAAADFVVSARDDPRRGAQRRCTRGEEIRLPGRPIVAMGTARAAGIARRTRALAVKIVADVDDNAGLRTGSSTLPMPAMRADLMFGASGNSQTRTGNAASGRARTFIVCSLPSTLI